MKKILFLFLTLTSLSVSAALPQFETPKHFEAKVIVYSIYTTEGQVLAFELRVPKSFHKAGKYNTTCHFLIDETLTEQSVTCGGQDVTK